MDLNLPIDISLEHRLPLNSIQSCGVPSTQNCGVIGTNELAI